MSRLLCIVATITFSSAFALPRSHSPSSAAGPQAAAFDGRLGPDDGAALAILFGANLRGNLEMCD